MTTDLFFDSVFLSSREGCSEGDNSLVATCSGGACSRGSRGSRDTGPAPASAVMTSLMSTSFRDWIAFMTPISM